MIKSLLLLIIAGMSAQQQGHAQLLMKAPPAVNQAANAVEDSAAHTADSQAAAAAGSPDTEQAQSGDGAEAAAAPATDHSTADTAVAQAAAAADSPDADQPQQPDAAAIVAQASLFGTDGRKNRADDARPSPAHTHDSAFNGEGRKNRSHNPADVLPAAADVPQLADLGISPAFDPALFAVNAREFDNGIRYTPAAEDERYYFHPAAGNFAHSRQAQGGGFYRRILGQTTEGSIVAQDFYQDIDAPQTSPFLLSPGLENDFSAASSNSRTLWYSPEGTVDMIADFYQGSAVGWNLILREGKPVMRLRESQDIEGQALSERLIFNAEGLPLIYSRNLSHTFYYPDGAAMFYIDESQDPAIIAAWDEQGQAVAPDSLRSAVQAIVEYQDELIDYLNDSREY